MTSANLFLLLHILSMGLILFVVATRIIEKRQPGLACDISKLPKTAVIVPVKGSPIGLRPNLLSLLNQDHPSYTVYFVTQDHADKAVSLIEELALEYNHAKLVSAGYAENCCQKNHNILAGARAADDAEILVFCDSSHFAERDWLAKLISPLLIKNDASISSGYHQLHVRSINVVETGRAICVHGLRLARMMPGFEQPWGGATAIRKENFEDLDIAKLWSDTVVDDVTLAKHLQRSNYKTLLPKDSDLRTVLFDYSWKGWIDWLTRQWAYLKFVFPMLWFMLGITGILFTLLLFISVVLVVLAPFIPFFSQFHIEAILGLGTFLLFTLLLRAIHPQPGPLLVWLPALPITLIIAGWCHMRTWFSMKICWSGITYTVKWGGKVSSIRR